MGISWFDSVVACFWPNFHFHDSIPGCGRNSGITNLPQDSKGIFERIIKAAIGKREESSEATQSQPTDPDKIIAYRANKIIAN